MTKPNFLFINTDQQRVDSMGCYGSKVARTPNLDKLAQEGVRFDRCYTANTVCMPARASWFTGKYPSQHGCWNNGVPLDQNSDMIQTRLKDAGYNTALIGKIHLDNIWLRKTPHPKYGFDVLLECEGDPYCKDDYFQWLDQNGLYETYMEQFKLGGHNERYVRDIPLEFHQNTWIAENVEEYFKERKEDKKPFFLSVGFFDPHHPFDPVEPYASMFNASDMPMPIDGDDEEAMTPYAKASRKHLADIEFFKDSRRVGGTIAAFHAMMKHLDETVGRILDSLNANGLAESTVIIFTSDHGELLGDHGMLHKGALFFDCSIRVPMIWHFPKTWNVSGVDNGFASGVDIAPTIAEIAQIKGPHLMQGRPLFDSNGKLRPMPPRDAALVEWRGERVLNGLNSPSTPAVRCLITDHWKFVHYQGKDFGELYDLHNDPQEIRNLWADPKKQSIVCEMREKLLAFILQSDPIPPRIDLF